MKKNIFKTTLIAALAATMVSCGSDSLDSKIYNGIDIETGLNSTTNIGTALNGAYYRLFYYGFAGNYAINIGDVVSDISYWNGKTGHFDGLYQMTYADTDTYLEYIWNYGYKIADNCARIIKAVDALEPNANATDKATLNQYKAEALALRGYAYLLMVNIYAHQYKVAGTSFADSKGIVLVDQPIEAFATVKRATVSETYNAIVSDFTNAITYFSNAGGDRGSLLYMNKAAVYGLLARAQLYMEDWANAASNAQKALDEAKITTLDYTADAYKKHYTNNTSNNESLFALAIDATNNWSANSSGTLWSTYNFSPSPYLQSLYGENDVRKSIWSWSKESTAEVPIFGAGKFNHYESNNSAYQTHYIVNAPEMFLIKAEAEYKQNSFDASRNDLLVVAKRNPAITDVKDLPQTETDLYQFIKDERARELFQEGMRLWDLRRWGEKANITAFGAPSITFTYTNYDISTLVFPIPVDEINAGFGVEQNTEWSDVMPK